MRPPDPTHSGYDGSTSDLNHEARLAAIGRAVESRLHRKGFDADLARDAVQEAFARAMQSTPWMLEPTSDLGIAAGWLFRTAHNYAIDETREEDTRGKYRLKVQSSRSEALALGGLNRRAMGSAADEAERAEEEERVQTVVEAAVLSLDDTLQSVVVLHYIEDWSVKKIAKLQGISVGAVHTRLHRARNNLAKQLEGLSDGNV